MLGLGLGLKLRLKLRFSGVLWRKSPGCSGACWVTIHAGALLGLELGLGLGTQVGLWLGLGLGTQVGLWLGLATWWIAHHVWKASPDGLGWGYGYAVGVMVMRESGLGSPDGLGLG